MVMRMGRGKAPQITFTLDFHQLVSGELAPGTRCAVRYDPLRIVPPDDGYRLGDPSRPVIGHFAFRDGAAPTAEVALQSPAGMPDDPDVDRTGQGSALIGEFDVPGDAEEVIAWFSFVDSGGRTRWDSAGGANYHFRFTLRELQILTADVENDDAGGTARFTLEVSVPAAATRVTARYRVTNAPAGDERREVELTRAGDAPDGGVLWTLPGLQVPHGAVLAFDLVYVVGGRGFKDDNHGRYHLAPRPSRLFPNSFGDTPGPPRELVAALERFAAPVAAAAGVAAGAAGGAVDAVAAPADAVASAGAAEPGDAGAPADAADAAGAADEEAVG